VNSVNHLITNEIEWNAMEWNAQVRYVYVRCDDEDKDFFQPVENYRNRKNGKIPAK
jgi:hypothetical protein